MDLTTRLLLPAAAAYHAHARHLTVPAVDFRKSFALMSAFTFTVCGVIAVLVLLGFNSMVARYCAPRAAQREQQVGLHRHSVQMQYWHISYSALLGFASGLDHKMLTNLSAYKSASCLCCCGVRQQCSVVCREEVLCRWSARTNPQLGRKLFALPTLTGKCVGWL